MNAILTKFRALVRRHGYDVVKYKQLPDLLRLHAIDTVLDIGANDGGYAGGLMESGWQGKIVSIEPQPGAFGRLQAAARHHPQWECHQLALGSKSEVLEMNTYAMDVLSSFLTKLENPTPVAKIAVPVERLDAALPRLAGKGNRLFVKIDTQGFEKSIIEGASGVMDDIVGFQLEMSVQPLYHQQMLIEDAIHLMRSKGFVLWNLLQGLRDPHTLQTFEMDGVFFRDPRVDGNIRI